jgi:hypothetical protein
MNLYTLLVVTFIIIGFSRLLTGCINHVSNQIIRLIWWGFDELTIFFIFLLLMWTVVFNWMAIMWEGWFFTKGRKIIIRLFHPIYYLFLIEMWGSYHFCIVCILYFFRLKDWNCIYLHILIFIDISF